MRIISKIFLVIMILIMPWMIMKAEGSLIINGRIDQHFNGKTIVIERVYPFRTALSRPKAECIVKQGKFFLQLPATALEQYMITFKGDARQNNAVSLVLMPVRTEINFVTKDLSNYTIVGNPSALVYKSSLLPILNRSKYTGDEVIKAITDWIENHQSSPLNGYLIFTNLLNNVTDTELLRLFKLIPASNRKGTYYDELDFITRNLYVDTVLPDFEQPDTSGVSVKLSNFRGSYILVDFWASWCVPCRAEYPQLIQAMQKYRHKNFGIISVSLDDKKELWLEAIRKDKLQNWTHVSDLKGWNNDVCVTYQIRSVPRNFLIGPDGKIIAKNLRGKEVPDLLDKLLNE